MASFLSWTESNRLKSLWLWGAWKSCWRRFWPTPLLLASAERTRAWSSVRLLVAIYFKWLQVCGCVSVMIKNKQTPSKSVKGVGETCLHLDLLKGRPCQGFQIITSAKGDREGFVLLWEEEERKNKWKRAILHKDLTFKLKYDVPAPCFCDLVFWLQLR